MQKPKTTPVPVRLEGEMRRRVKSAAGKLGTNASAFIRYSILNQLDEIERTGELRVRAAK